MPSQKITGIAAFDLDGTLLRNRTVCEVLAEPLGKRDRMSYFESCVSEPEIATARAEMASWYRECGEDELQKYLVNACWAPGVHAGIKKLHDAGIEVAILSVTWDFAVRWFAKQLGVQCWLGTELRRDGMIKHCWGRDKATFLRQLVAQKQIARDRVAAIGDSSSDIPMLEEAAVRIFVGSTLPILDNVLHLPNSSIETIADMILQQWA